MGRNGSGSELFSARLPGFSWASLTSPRFSVVSRLGVGGGGWGGVHSHPESEELRSDSGFVKVHEHRLDIVTPIWKDKASRTKTCGSLRGGCRCLC